MELRVNNWLSIFTWHLWGNYDTAGCKSEQISRYYCYLPRDIGPISLLLIMSCHWLFPSTLHHLQLECDSSKINAYHSSSRAHPEIKNCCIAPCVASIFPFFLNRTERLDNWRETYCPSAMLTTEFNIFVPLRKIFPACYQWQCYQAEDFPSLSIPVYFPASFFPNFSSNRLWVLVSSLPFSLFLPLSVWTGTEPTNTAIKRTPVSVWKHYQGLAKLTLPLHTLTWIDVFVCTLCVQPTIRHLIRRERYAIWLFEQIVQKVTSISVDTAQAHNCFLSVSPNVRICVSRQQLFLATVWRKKAQISWVQANK